MSTMTGDRYGLADKAVWRVGYGAMQLAGDVLLIPGTSSRDHLAENLAVGSASLQDDEIASLARRSDPDLPLLNPHYSFRSPRRTP